MIKPNVNVQDILNSVFEFVTPDAPFNVIEGALRDLAALLKKEDADDTRRAVARGGAIKHLKGIGAQSPVRLVDAALGKPDEGDRAAQGHEIPFSLPEPWPDPVEGVALFAEIKSFIQRYLILPAGALGAVAAWVLATWAVKVFDISAYLAVVSPTRECGKSRLLEVIELLARKPFNTIYASEASMFRIMDQEEPTMIMDESEALSGQSERAAAIRSMLNAGHRRGPGVPRCEGDKNKVRWFRVFGFYAIAAIGKLWDTIEGRSIVIHMRRKSRDEQVQRFRLRKAKREVQDLSRRIARWIQDALGQIESVEPQLPNFLDDRSQDVWECLLSVGQAIGEDTYLELVECARLLKPADIDEDDSPRVQILRDLTIIFGSESKIFSESICRALAQMEDRKWPEYRNGKPITSHQLARLLKDFHRPDGVPINPKKIRIGTEVKQGYERSWFDLLFNVYAPEGVLRVEQPEQPEQPNNDAGLSGFSNRNIDSRCSTSKSASNPHKHWDVPDVPVPEGVSGEKAQRKMLEAVEETVRDDGCTVSKSPVNPCKESLVPGVPDQEGESEGEEWKDRLAGLVPHRVTVRDGRIVEVGAEEEGKVSRQEKPRQ